MKNAMLGERGHSKLVPLVSVFLLGACFCAVVVLGKSWLEFSPMKVEVEVPSNKEAEQNYGNPVLTPYVNVAFSVARTDPLGPFPNDTTMQWNYMFANAGGAFDMGTGVFTAPVGGTYYFSWNGQKRSNTNDMALYLEINGAGQAGIYEDNWNGGGGIFTPTLNPGNAQSDMVVHLYPGDRVHLRLNDEAYPYSTSFGKYTGFTGFLLFADF
ncbi:PREDICTED: cerebellin-3-like [Branchiostoma belcheri]|uniref:Cerebellin-3-like n=1 Tax=Branchiostoma belcheri TaxID=7741 RepID=A0A6P4YZ10_BRABE|nr:PREDICTED: cerebellin-3-like [Branchiostoma belcheri]